MSLPQLPDLSVRAGIRCEVSPRALERWNPSLQVAEDEPGTISILDVIG